MIGERCIISLHFFYSETCENYIIVYSKFFELNYSFEYGNILVMKKLVEE